MKENEEKIALLSTSIDKKVHDGGIINAWCTNLD